MALSLPQVRSFWSSVQASPLTMFSCAESQSLARAESRDYGQDRTRRMPYFVLARKVPDFHDAITAAACESLKGVRVLGHGVSGCGISPIFPGLFLGRSYTPST
jgi:hypothetical protein